VRRGPLNSRIWCQSRLWEAQSAYGSGRPGALDFSAVPERPDKSSAISCFQASESIVFDALRLPTRVASVLRIINWISPLRITLERSLTHKRNGYLAFTLPSSISASDFILPENQYNDDILPEVDIKEGPIVSPPLITIFDCAIGGFYLFLFRLIPVLPGIAIKPKGWLVRSLARDNVYRGCHLASTNPLSAPLLNPCPNFLRLAAVTLRPQDSITRNTQDTSGNSRSVMRFIVSAPRFHLCVHLMRIQDSPTIAVLSRQHSRQLSYLLVWIVPFWEQDTPSWFYPA